MSIITQIVGRCHVGQSNRAVIHYVISRLKNKYITFQAMPKADRRVLLSETIKEHQENRELYSYVMQGSR